jgi:hemoglobin/transferrin/lactoferrin receptor protein
VTESANVAAAELEGVEAEAIYDSDRFRLRASYSVVDGEITALDPATAPGTGFAVGDKVGTLTPARLSIDARWKLPARRLALGARLQLADDFDKVNDPSEERAGYAVVDLYATWRPAFAPRARLDVGVDNVLDHDYDRVFAGVSEPGRNAKVAITYALGGAG